MRGSIGVRINDGVTDRIVTSKVRDFSFTKVAPGGHQSMRLKVDLPRGVLRDLGPTDRVYAYDSRNGRTIIDGYTENPGITDGPGGSAYDITAYGGMVLASDETRALIYVDRNLSAFEKEPSALASSSIEVGNWEDDLTKQRLRVTIPAGSVVSPGSYASAVNSMYARADMRLGGIHVDTFYGGKSDSGYALDFTTPTGIVIQVPMTNAYTLNTFVGDPNFPSGTDFFALKLRRTGGATNIADDLTWGAWADYSTIGQRVDRYGNLLAGVGDLVTASSVLASEVAADILGRLLKQCDPTTAVVDKSQFPIRQLAYPDGVKAVQVLNDLALYEPDYLWEILETLPGGRHRFNYRAWPTTPRYEVSTKDGYVESGSDVDLCNRILVSWTDAAGATQTTIVTAASMGLSVPELGTRVKDADPISLPTGGTEADALRVGAEELRAKINPPHAARVTVRRPIRDLLTGHMVMPWEIEPGYLVRVRELGRNMRLTQVDYADNDCAATLDLGDPVLTQQQRLARLAVA